MYIWELRLIWRELEIILCSSLPGGKCGMHSLCRICRNNVHRVYVQMYNCMVEAF